MDYLSRQVVLSILDGRPFGEYRSIKEATRCKRVGIDFLGYLYKNKDSKNRDAKILVINEMLEEIDQYLERLDTFSSIMWG